MYLHIITEFYITGTNNKTISDGVKKIFWPGRIQLINKNPDVIFDVAHNEDSFIALCHSVESINNNGRKFLLLSMQKTKFLTNSLSLLKNTFDKIICTKLNDKMYTSLELYNILYPFDDLSCYEDAKNSIENIQKMMDINDLLVIAGSHYWGEHISSNFKFFLGNNTIKS